MTSSLVGSEMCIRDSPHDRDRIARCFSNTITATPPPPMRIELTEQQQAVSYTHLTLPTICSV
eukprot:8750476-Prorocentrum_lima.AAC.1